MNNDLNALVELWIKEHEENNKPIIHTGNTRYVYELTDGYIIKECTEFCDDDGLYCNEKEYNLYQNATEQERNFLNPTVGIYKNNQYIVSKECYPLDYFLLELVNQDISVLEKFEDIEDFIRVYPQYNTNNVNIKEISNFCSKNNIHEGEFRLLYNWGLLDNKLVCLDYN